MKYDLKTNNILKLLQENFNISVVDLLERGFLDFIINSTNYTAIVYLILNLSKKDFKDDNHKKNYALKALGNLKNK